MDADAWINWGDEAVPVWLVRVTNRFDVYRDESGTEYEVYR